MKTKEIDMYVKRDLYNGVGVTCDKWILSPERQSVTDVRVRVIVEIPDRTATITESEFEEYIKKIEDEEELHCYASALKEKLFGGKNDHGTK